MGNIIVKGNTVIAPFKDGIILTCGLRPPMAKQVRALERICLLQGIRRQVTFNVPNPNRRALSQQPNGFIHMSSNWTPQEFAHRWRRVMDHVDSQQDNLAAAWAILRLGQDLLKQIENGTWPAPEQR